jgi:Mg2+-importing ATPase
LITKGAPEGILDLSESYETEGRVVPLDAAAKNRCRQIFCDLSAQGFRVLAVAYRMADSHCAFTVANEHSLILVSRLAFADPPNPDAAQSLVAMSRDGVEVKILTGDNELVARHICEQFGIKNPTIILGEELERTSDPALQHLAEETTVLRVFHP